MPIWHSTNFFLTKCGGIGITAAIKNRRWDCSASSDPLWQSSLSEFSFAIWTMQCNYSLVLTSKICQAWIVFHATVSIYLDGDGMIFLLQRQARPQLSTNFLNSKQVWLRNKYSRLGDLEADYMFSGCTFEGYAQKFLLAKWYAVLHVPRERQKNFMDNGVLRWLC